MSVTICELFELEYIYELPNQKDQSNIAKNDELITFIMLIRQGSYAKCYSFGEELLTKYSDDINTSAFILNWLIICTEKQYILDLRKKYLDNLEDLSNKYFSLYAEFLKLYFLGVTYFFSAMLHESETAFNRAIKLGNQLNYERGLARCYLHLAFISFDSNKIIEGFQNLNHCQKICIQYNLLKTLERVQVEKMSHDSQFKIIMSDSFEFEINKIKKAIADHDINYARLLLVNLEKKRRSLYNRKKWTLAQYLVQILFLRNKTKSARRIMANIKDKIIKTSLYNFMQTENILLSDLETIEYRQLRILYQLSENLEHSEKIIKISDISKHSVKLLLEILNKSQDAVSKEMICEFVFHISYDPVIHDSKIYKLILSARKQLGYDFLINEYGAYRLNMKKYKFIS